MDKDKDFLTSEQEIENIIKTDTDTMDSNAFEVSQEEITSAESDDNTVTDNKAAKKQMILQRTIFGSMILVIIALAVALVLKYFFNTSLVNTDTFGNKTNTTWHYTQDIPYTDVTATGDEAVLKTTAVDAYYEFTGDGKVIVKSGTVESEGEYTLRYVNEDDISGVENGEELLGKPIVDIDVYDPVLGTNIAGLFTYDVSGNAFSGKNMRLASLYAENMYLDFDDKAFEETVLKHEDKFTPNKDLVGSWNYQNESGNQTYTFREDGTVSVEIIQPQYGYHFKENGIYYCDDSKIDLTLFLCIEQNSTINYTLRDGKFIYISNILDANGKPIEIEFTKI